MAGEWGEGQGVGGQAWRDGAVMVSTRMTRRAWRWVGSIGGTDVLDAGGSAEVQAAGCGSTAGPSSLVALLWCCCPIVVELWY